MDSLSNAKNAAVDFADKLRTAFKKYTLTTRERAWNGLSSTKGLAEIDKLLKNPDRSLNTIRNLNFKEWLEKAKS